MEISEQQLRQAKIEARKSLRAWSHACFRARQIADCLDASGHGSHSLSLGVLDNLVAAEEHCIAAMLRVSILMELLERKNENTNQHEERGNSDVADVSVEGRASHLHIVR